MTVAAIKTNTDVNINVIFPPNITPTLIIAISNFDTEKYIFKALILFLPHLKQHSLINETL